MSVYLSVRELAGLALPTGKPDGMFVMLRAYFDDSGSHADSEIVAIGGLVGTVSQSRVISTSSAIDKRAWDELVIGENRAWLGDALDVCVENSLSEAIKIAGPHPEGDQIAVVFDRGIWTPRLKEVTDGYTYPMGRPRITTVAFSSVEDVLPLQGADIAATENYWHAIKVLRHGFGAQPRAHMRHYLAGIPAEGFLIDRARIVEMLPEMEANVRTLKEQSS